jgi:hypothetical protein
MTITGLAKQVRLSRSQLSNFLAGRSGINGGAAAMLREYAFGNDAALASSVS